MGKFFVEAELRSFTPPVEKDERHDGSRGIPASPALQIVSSPTIPCRVLSRLVRVYSRVSDTYHLRPVKVAKADPHVGPLLEAAVRLRRQRTIVGEVRREDDPRNIFPYVHRKPSDSETREALLASRAAHGRFPGALCFTFSRLIHRCVIVFFVPTADRTTLRQAGGGTDWTLRQADRVFESTIRPMGGLSYRRL